MDIVSGASGIACQVHLMEEDVTRAGDVHGDIRSAVAELESHVR